MAYNTGNPLGSSDFKDLSDNAVDFDKYSNGPDPTYPNRLGALKLSISGMNEEFNNAQEGREAAFQEFLSDSAFIFIGDYGPGLNFTNRSQYLIRDGVPYRLAPGATLPYTTSGNWALEVSNFTPVSSDDILRQDLGNAADVDMGAALVARGAVRVSSIVELLSLTPDESQTYLLDGFHTGSSAGGSPIRWNPSRLKSEHNGGTIISNTVPWSGAFATLADFLNGVGETSPSGSGCYERTVTKYIEAEWFGVKSNDVATDNSAPLAKAFDAVGAITPPNRPQFLLPTGDTYYSISPNFGEFSGVSIIGAGPDNCRLHYTGTGKAFNVNPGLLDIQFRYRIHLQGFLVDCGPSATHGVYIENVAQSTAYEVYALNGSASCILFNLALAVLWHFDTCGMTVNYWPVTSVHAETFRLTSSPTKSQKSTDVAFTNCTAEGASLAGIRGISADLISFYNGTAETNTGRGVLIANTCKSWRFMNVAMEANGTSDVTDDGYGTSWDSVYSISVGGFNIGNTALQNQVRGGFFNQFTIIAGANQVSVTNIGVNHAGTGGFTDGGTDTEVRGIYDRTAAAYIYPKKARVAITVGASPFTYTNTTGRYQMVLVSGGTVTQILYVHDADAGGLIGSTGGSFLVAPGDGLRISHSGAPTMSRVPLGSWAL